jgi:hypothetical protein
MLGTYFEEENARVACTIKEVVPINNVNGRLKVSLPPGKNWEGTVAYEEQRDPEEQVIIVPIVTPPFPDGTLVMEEEESDWRTVKDWIANSVLLDRP